jgi:hypothetical protein
VPPLVFQGCPGGIAVVRVWLSEARDRGLQGTGLLEGTQQVQQPTEPALWP